MKCKLCNNFMNSICILYSSKRSPGKKRYCCYFDEKKIVKKELPVRRVPWMSKSDKKNEIKRYREEMIKLLDKAKLVEQQQALITQSKTKPEIVTHAEPVISPKGKGFFKKIFNRGGEK